MKTKKFLSLMLCVAVLLSAIGQISFAKAVDTKMSRQVYLYAQSMSGTDNGGIYKLPLATSDEMTTVYADDTANIFLAVDAPNKGDGTNEDGSAVPHKYDLNGYTVKISYDSNFFDFASPIEPFDYTYPNRYGKSYGDSGEADPDSPDTAPDKIGYMTHLEGRGDVQGTSYKTAYATVMLGGETFPETEDSKNYWYNLLCLPLKPIKTGYTEVWVDIVDNDGYGLSLIAKNTSTDINEQTFKLDIKNGGVHKIMIRDKDRPNPPVATPASKTDTKPFSVTLDCDEKINDNQPCCNIFYYLNDDKNTLTKYSWNSDANLTEKIDIITATKISCYCVRESDKKESLTAEYNYSIVPPRPYLFDEYGTAIPNSYTKDGSFDVYAAVGEIYAAIPANNHIYYTYAPLDDTADFDFGNTTNPETRWARLDSTNPKISVSSNRIIRLITVGPNEKSEISEYNLKISSAPSANAVKAPIFAPESAQFTKATDSVTIYCADSFFENIGITNTNTRDYTLLYTTDGTDPIINGIPADTQSDMVRIPVSKNMEIKAVVKQGDNYSDVISHRYYIRTDRPVRPLVISAPPSNTPNKTAFKFAHLPDGIDIYYVTGDKNQYLAAPEIKAENKYTRGQIIEVGENTQIKAVSVHNKYGTKSDLSLFVYDELPKALDGAPEFVYDSGYYTKNDVVFSLDPLSFDAQNAPWYRQNDYTEDYSYEGREWAIGSTTSYRAYNHITDSEIIPAFCYYIVETESYASGNVDILPPYDKAVISADDLGSGDYLKGIKLYSAQASNGGAKINYKYSYTLADGGRLIDIAQSNVKEYDDAITVHNKFYDIDIEAWLVNPSDNSIIGGSTETFHIDFIATPKAVQSDKTYTIEDVYSKDDRSILYYTTDKTDPSDSLNVSRKIYDGRSFNIKDYPNVKAVYFRACGSCGNCTGGNGALCPDGIYGKVGTYTFSLATEIVTVGGGGGTVDKTRKYTKDIFGTEHPTHIGYINGYPDGSVMADGNITREEIASVLYRIKYKEYDEPFVATGNLFSDVPLSRWSANDIEFMAQKDVIYGYPDGEFKPAGKLTRGEFAALIRRFTELSMPSKENKFPDVDQSYWGYEDIMIVSKAGLMQGYEDGSFRPDRHITRAEVMKVINAILGRCPDEDYVKGLDFNPFNDLDREKWYYVTVLEATITHDYYLNANANLETKWENWK